MLSSRCLSPGSIVPLAAACADGWIPGTRPGMTVADGLLAMTDLVVLVIAGLATGAIYALAAIGFTLLWQTSQTINFAQGEFVMLPAFFALAAMKWLGLPFSIAALLAITLAMLMLGLLFKAIIVDPLIRQGVLPLVISTIALA